MTDFNTYKKDACKVIAGVSDPVSLNDVERKAYVTHLGDTGNNGNLTELEKQFFKSLTPVPLTGSHNDVVGKVAKNYSGNSDGSYNDAMKDFWQDVAENGLEADRIRYRYDFDGVDDRITVLDIPLEAGTEFSVTFIAPNAPLTSNTVLLGGEQNGTNFSTIYFDQATGFIGFSNASTTGTLDGAPIGHQDTPYPTDGAVHTITATLNNTIVGASVKFIGANNGYGAGATFPIYDVGVTSPSGNRFYPIDDGWSNNPVIRDTLNPQSGQPELLTNGDFSDGTNGWTIDASRGTFTVSGGVATLQTDPDTGDGVMYIRQFGILQPNTTYLISGNVANLTGTWSIFTDIDGGTYPINASSEEGNFEVVFEVGSAAGSLMQFQVNGNSNTSVDFDNLSVKEYTHGIAENFEESNWEVINWE